MCADEQGAAHLAREGGRFGDATISLMWNDETDLDLHVLPPMWRDDVLREHSLVARVEWRDRPRPARMHVTTPSGETVSYQRLCPTKHYYSPHFIQLHPF